MDTNFLLVPGQFNVNIFLEFERIMDEPFELCVLEGTLEELQELAEGNSKKARDAKLGYVLAEQKGLKKLRGSQDHVDDALVNMVDDETLIATQDKELKQRVKEKGGKVITVRNKQHLVKEG